MLSHPVPDFRTIRSVHFYTGFPSLGSREHSTHTPAYKVHYNLEFFIDIGAESMLLAITNNDHFMDFGHRLS